MRIAILFTGRVKGFENCEEKFKQFILESIKTQGHTYDIFLSHNKMNKEDNVETFVKNYNVVAWNSKFLDLSWIEKNVIIPEQYEHICYNSLFMFYHWNDVFEIMETYSKEKNINYDLIMYARADMIPEKPLLLPTVYNDKIVYTTKRANTNLLNDQFIIGNFYTMKEIMSIFNYLLDYQKRNVLILHAELTLEMHYYINKIGIINIDFPFELEPSRRAGTFFNLKNVKEAEEFYKQVKNMDAL